MVDPKPELLPLSERSEAFLPRSANVSSSTTGALGTGDQRRGLTAADFEAKSRAATSTWSSLGPT
ncbi:MAG: hypothetical protein R2710_11150 [Acidimicrobiales bacterium]